MVHSLFTINCRAKKWKILCDACFSFKDMIIGSLLVFFASNWSNVLYFQILASVFSFLVFFLQNTTVWISVFLVLYYFTLYCISAYDKGIYHRDFWLKDWISSQIMEVTYGGFSNIIFSHLLFPALPPSFLPVSSPPLYSLLFLLPSPLIVYYLPLFICFLVLFPKGIGLFSSFS